MGRIQSSVGLISGIDIGKLVEQLLEVSAQPKKAMEQRLESLVGQRQAVTELMTQVIGLQLSARQLGQSTLFDSRRTSSSVPDAVGVKKTGTPELGSYAIEVLQTSQRQQSISQAFALATVPLGTRGQLVIGTDQSIDDSMPLDRLNGGQGLTRGVLRIHDRQGVANNIDLRRVQSIEDVLRQIAEQSQGRIVAEIRGDALQIRDRSGGNGRLQIQDPPGSSVAASLGLDGIDVAESIAEGTPIVRVSPEVPLSTLLDDRGIRTRADTSLSITFRDGSQRSINIGDFSRPAGYSTGSTTTDRPNERLTFRAIKPGGDDDGLRVRIVDDPTLIAGAEQVQLIGEGFERELMFRIAAGSTTASQIVAALEREPTLSKLYSAVADGDGSGTVRTSAAAVLRGGAAQSAPADPTVGDLLDRLNQADPRRLLARIAPDGLRLELIDLTEGTGAFSAVDQGDGELASRLGLAGSTTDALLRGARLQPGLQGVLLSSLGGGAGLPPLGELEILTADGRRSRIDLSNASTIADVIQAINASGLPISAQFNARGDGLALRDQSRTRVNPLRVFSDDHTAAALGLEGETTQTTLEGAGLARRTVERQTRLSELNDGRGVALGSFTITNSSGARGTVRVTRTDQTLGELIDAISALGIGVTAQVNGQGDGLALIDSSQGGGTLSVAASSAASTAANLYLLRPARVQLVGSQAVQSIDGSPRERLEFTGDESLADFVSRINQSSKLASASTITDEQGKTRLVLTSKRDGTAGRLQIDDSNTPLRLFQRAAAQDAIISIGDPSDHPTFLRSNDNIFDEALPGLSLTATQVTTKPARIDVTEDGEAIQAAVQRFVSQYNEVIDKAASLTSYDPVSGSTGLLFGSGDVLRLQGSLGRLISGRFTGAPELRSLAAVGLNVDQDGQLSFEAGRFAEQLAQNPDGVARLFTEADRGFAAQLNRLADQFASADSGSLIARSQSINSQIDNLDQRISGFEDRLERERTRLLKQFYAMERALARIRANSQYLGRIQSAGQAGDLSL